MRARFYPLLAAIAATACSPVQLTHAPTRGAGTLDNICALHVLFPDETARLGFMSSNAANLVAQVRDQNAYVVDDGRGFIFYAPASDCGSVSLDRSYGFAGGDSRVIRREEIAVAEARQRVELSLGSGAKNGTALRACVLQFPRAGQEDVADLVLFLPYTGLRGVQVLGADGLLYVASDEDCTLAARFVVAAMRRMHGSPPGELRECPNSSLMSCGYPSDIRYGPASIE